MGLPVKVVRKRLTGRQQVEGEEKEKFKEM